MINFIRIFKSKLRDGTVKDILNEMKWIYKCSLKYKKAVIWYIFVGVFSTGLGLLTSVVSKYIIDAVTGYDSSLIVPAAIGYAAMQLLQVGANAYTSRISAKIRIGVNQEIREEVFKKILQSDWERVSVYHSGDLLNRVNVDVDTISNSIMGWIPNLIIGLAQFFGALFLIMYYDPTLALLAMLSAPVTLFMSKYLMGKLRNYNVKIRKASSRLMSFNEETLQNIQYIKSFGLVEKYGVMFTKEQEEYRKLQLDYNKFSIGTTSVLTIVGMVVSGICFGWGVYRLWTNVITYGTMTLFLQMSGNLSASFTSLVNTVPNAILSATAAGRIMEITNIPEENTDISNQTEKIIASVMEKGAGIQFENVSFSYSDGKKVLDNINIDVSPGEIAAFVGPSGEGKTTILKALLGLIKIDSGRISIVTDTEKCDVSPDTRKIFAYVPQGNTMMSGTIAENLRMIKGDATDEELWKALENACADTFVKELQDGIYTFLKERGGGLSEGQLQRLSIARALLCDVPVLLLDEATSALDLETEKKLLKNISGAAGKKTCIIITHRPQLLSICNKVYLIKDCESELLDMKD